jgi:hypothetical protein
MHSDLTSVLTQVGKPLEQHLSADGSRLLLLPYGGRVLGLFAPGCDENFFWTHPALASGESAQAFFHSNDWHNTGGDRTWLAPEADIFLPKFPDTGIYQVPVALDPGSYEIVGAGPALRFETKFTVTLSRSGAQVEGLIAKSWGPALNPLRHEPLWRELAGVAFAGYTQETSLELSSSNSAPVGLWNLLALPEGGEVIIPTHTREEPRVCFGPVAPSDVVVTEHLVRFRTGGTGVRKIGLRAVSSTGRIGYIYPNGKDWSLVVRNFTVNPSGEYIDVPWEKPDPTRDSVYSTQACSVHNELGFFCELEYHAPAIGAGTGRTRSHDASQVWAFRGSQGAIQRVAGELLSPEAVV